MFQQQNNVQYAIRERIQHAAPCSSNEATRIVVDALVCARADLRKEPSLEEMKRILVEALRAARKSQSLAC